jgi:MFS family permease
MVLLGVGAGMAFPALTILAMADVTPSDSGLASGLLNTTTQVGGALGLAILATLATNQTGQLIAARQSVVAALSGSYHLTWAIGAGLVIATIVLAATLLKGETTAGGETAPGADDRPAEEMESSPERVEICA